MTVHRVALRAGVVTAMAAALLSGLLTAPAHAQPQLRLGQIGNIELRVGGGTAPITIQVQNTSNDPVNGTATGVQLTMTVPLAELGVHIASGGNGCNLTNDNTRMDCNLGDIPRGESRSVTAQIGVQGNSTLQSGETRNGNAQVALNSGGQTSFNVRLQGPERQQPVADVSGIVTDQNTGDGIEGATVFITDSQGEDHDDITNAEGQFSFQGQDIAAGTIGIQASADEYETTSITEDVEPGGSLTGLQLALVSTAPPTSAPPTSAPPPTSEAPTVAPPLEETSGGGGTFTTIMIILGILFVLLGIGAIVFLIIRRRREQGEDDGPEGADGPLGPRGPSPTPGSHGVYRPTPTQVMGPRGPLPAVGPQPALANAPTMMHPRAGADQTALLPRAGDASATSPMHPVGPRPPVAGSPPPPRPAAPTYGSPAASTQAFDSPTGRHAGSAPGQYDDSTQLRQPYGDGQYGSPAGRHERGGGYGSSYDNNSSYGPDPYTRPQPSYDQGGYRDGGGYDRSAADHRGGHDYGSSGDYRGAGYGGADQGGYDQRGHEQGGYGQHGHDRQPGHDQNGYDQGGYGGQGYGQAQPGGHAQPGYDQRYDQPTQQRGYGNEHPDDATTPRSRHAADPPERRRLDWLDQ